MRELTLAELELVAGGDASVTVTGPGGGGGWDGGDWGYDGGDSGGGGDSGVGAGGDSDPDCNCGHTTPNIDHGFIDQHEGGVTTTANVPGAGHSGVTIGAGVDLGQQSISGLQGMGVSQSIIDQVSPYLGLQRDAAQSYLDDHPLTMSLADATALTDAVQNEAMTHIASAYDAASAAAGANLHFDELPTGVQTAIADVAYQYTSPTNPHLDQVTPNFWSDVTKGDWTSTVHELNNFGDIYGPRREDEAKLVQADINRGLQNGSSCDC